MCGAGLPCNNCVKYFPGVPTGTAGDSVWGIDTGTSPWTLYIFHSGVWNQVGGGGGGGTVTSVGMTGDGVIYNSTVTGSPVTSSGTLVPALLTQTANEFLGGPTSGVPATPTFRAIVMNDLPADAVTTDILLVLDGGGSSLANGARINVFVDFAGTIKQITEGADQSGSVNLDIQTCSQANYQPGVHPVAADSITGASPPDISATYKYQDSTLTGWTTAFSAGTWFSLTATNAATNITRVSASLKVIKS